MRYYAEIDGKRKGWKESALDDPVSIMETYEENVFIYDADYCGEEKFFFAFGNGEYWKMTHSWWIETDPDWYVGNEFGYEKVSKSEANDKIISDRDWIIL